jgi:succinoglycan biosynthesis transport protein ExoP
MSADKKATKAVPSVRSGLFDVESPMAIELRRIMIRLGRQLDFERKRCIMITSASRGEGKSLFSLHFSLVLAYHLPRRVLLLDGDIRRPVQHTVFQRELSPGFAELLRDEAPVDKVARETSVKNLDFIPAGEAGGRPSRLFADRRLRTAMDKLRATYDIIVLDAPPVVPVSDPLHFLDIVDGVLYLVMAGHTPRELSRRGVQILSEAGAKILGAVANNLSEVLPYYYDQKYYGYDGSRKKRRA